MIKKEGYTLHACKKFKQRKHKEQHVLGKTYRITISRLNEP